MPPPEAILRPETAADVERLPPRYRERYRERVRVKPRAAEVHHNLALALAQQGRRSEAAEHFRRGLAIKPGLREAQSNLDQMLAGSSPTK